MDPDNPSIIFLLPSYHKVREFQITVFLLSSVLIPLLLGKTINRKFQTKKILSSFVIILPPIQKANFITT